MKKFIILIIFLIPAICSGQMKSSIKTYGFSGKYIKYEPTTMKPVGVILYFHGAGERGSDISVLERNELPKLFKNGVEKPFIVICPQLAGDKTSWGTNEIVTMLNILDTYEGLEKHVTGLSLGGMATYSAVIKAYEYMGNKPGYFKTAVSVCGRTSTSNWQAFQGTAVKVYHGTKDTTVPISPDIALVKLLQNNNVDVQSVFYEGAGHIIWGTAYNESESSYWKYLKQKIEPPPVSTPDSVRVKIYVEGDRPISVETVNIPYN